MDKICYKVVAFRNSSFLSTSAEAMGGNKNFLTYQLGETTYPKIGEIFVFDTIENARTFMIDLHWPGFLVLKGIAKNISHPKKCSRFYSDIELFWKLKKQKKSHPTKFFFCC